MKIISRQTFILIALALLFLAPGIAALYVYQHPQWLGGHPTNKGTFIRPPLLVGTLTKLNDEVKDKPVSHTWHLVYWAPQTCDETCLDGLEHLARIRLALGRRFYEVDEVLMIKAMDSSLLAESMTLLNRKGVKVLSVNGAELAAMNAESSKPQIYIANPEGFLVLSYPIDVALNDIYLDLKQLLTTTQTKSN
jgi:hypothetical protein